jgi:hypothetical protein
VPEVRPRLWVIALQQNFPIYAVARPPSPLLSSKPISILLPTMRTTCANTKKVAKLALRRVTMLRGPYPTEEEFEARLRELGFRPATAQEASCSRAAQARIRRT